MMRRRPKKRATLIFINYIEFINSIGIGSGTVRLKNGKIESRAFWKFLRKENFFGECGNYG
jgi:hypothetical protein